MFRSIALAIVIGPLAAGALFAADRVEFDLVTEKGFPITGQQEWLRALADVGAQVRIRGADENVEPSIVTRGAGESKIHVVTGLLTARDALLLPGARFGIRDKQKIADWVGKLKAGGAEEVTAERGAFGLTGEQLLAVHEQLAAPVAVATKDRPVKKALNGIVSGLKIKVVVPPGALADVAPEDVLLDELQGLSAGTALAAALRPYGLAFTVRKAPGKDAELLVAPAADLEEAWPVGWPLEKPPLDAVPKLFAFLEVEIDDTPLSEALAVVGGRLEAPLLFDHNGLAAARIDPAKVKVSLRPGRTYYNKILDSLLNQAKMNFEVRLDEAEKPFLWIAPDRLK